MSVIHVKDLNYSYEKGKPVIRNVSFDIEEGSYTTVIGHNGSGKSTIAKLLLGLLEKESGTIEIGGLPLTLENLGEIRNRIGIVFQNPDNQFIGSTVRDDIAFGLENHCVEREKMDGLIEEFAEKVGMTDFLNSEPGKLSGGQKQRVAIASVLAMNLGIIVFDEATSMLDPTGKRDINRLISQIHNENKLTVISITHDIEEVVQSDNVLVIDHGTVAMQGKPEEIFKNEKLMVKMQLDIPFVYKLRNELAARGVKLPETLDMERMADEVCQYALKK
ncbi:MAG: energy-coupling factor transporter ATPase [Erysipelotrichaceae bacterium]|nr:energy-coupling factor transporter ATPase [Erysipelotrichaceae bacterium]MBO4537617.1 energy-coupling factor transporter ATPase [Erysipelotrichaceae bacterium]MBR5049634.1 energy-coupling factor transporter ATPase [Erysipelotrichaceae bacterium]